MGEVIVAIIGLIGTISVGMLFSQPSALHVFLSWRALFIGLLAGWIISKGVAAHLGLAWFPTAFEKATTDVSLIMSFFAWEAVILAAIVVIATVRHSKNNPSQKDPLADFKRREAARQRWMKDMGE